MSKIKQLMLLERDVGRLEFKHLYALNAALPIHPSQFKTMLTVKEHSGATQREIAESMRISAATAAVSLKRLERDGFVRREQDTEDARSIRVHITDRGRAVCEEAFENLTAVYALEFKDFTDDELTQCIELMRRREINLNSEKERTV